MDKMKSEAPQVEVGPPRRRAILKALGGVPVILTLSAGSAFGAHLSGGSLISNCKPPRDDDTPVHDPQLCPSPPTNDDDD